MLLSELWLFILRIIRNTQNFVSIIQSLNVIAHDTYVIHCVLNTSDTVLVVIRLLFTTSIILFFFGYNSVYSFIATTGSGTSCLVYFATSHLFTKYCIMLWLLYGYKPWDINSYHFNPMVLNVKLLLLLFLYRSFSCFW